MSKYEGHTPGPWKAERIPEGVLKVISVIVTKRDYFITAIDGTETHGFVAITNSAEADEANARLIADAPMLAEQNAKMLAALKRARDFYDGGANRGMSLWLHINKLISEMEAE